jgi:dihydrofolate reductase/thymidylate synthase
MNFDIVVATDIDRGIGKGGKMAWRLKAEQQYFRDLTVKTNSPDKQNAVIMGRITWESLPSKLRPLPGRLNVVITRNNDYQLPDDVIKVASLDMALEKLSALNIEKCFLIGGGQIYKEGLEHKNCHKLYLTEIKNSFDCDIFFPAYDQSFQLESESLPQKENEIAYCYKVLVKA